MNRRDKATAAARAISPDAKPMLDGASFTRNGVRYHVTGDGGPWRVEASVRLRVNDGLWHGHGAAVEGEAAHADLATAVEMARAEFDKARAALAAKLAEVTP